MELASTCRRVHTGLEGTANSVAIAGRDRWFESTSLQRGVGLRTSSHRPAADGRPGWLGQMKWQPGPSDDPWVPRLPLTCAS